MAAYSRRLAAFSPRVDPSGRDVAESLLSAHAAQALRADANGSENHAVLLEPAVVQAQRFGLTDERGIAAVLLLMFAYGHECCDDPAQDWVRGHLVGHQASDPAERVERLLGDLTQRLERQPRVGNAAALEERLLPGGVRLKQISLASQLDRAELIG
ncbi:MAG: hypothetical protein ABI564_09780 [Ideonella sp.]